MASAPYFPRAVPLHSLCCFTSAVDDCKRQCAPKNLLLLQAALSRGLLPDDETLKQLVLDPELPLTGRDISTLRWPEEPLRYVLTSEQNSTTSPLSNLVTMTTPQTQAFLRRSC